MYGIQLGSGKYATYSGKYAISLWEADMRLGLVGSMQLGFGKYFLRVWEVLRMELGHLGKYASYVYDFLNAEELRITYNTQ